MNQQYNIASQRFTIVLGLITLIFGFGLGAYFGAAEEQLKDTLQHKAHEVLETVYNGDPASADKVVSKSWSYYKRAHMHANGLGVVTLALAFLFAGLPITGRIQTLPTILFSIGGLGYGLFWFLAGNAAPSLGGTDAAKEAFAWLAIPSTGLMLFGLIAALFLTVRCWLLPKK